MLPGPAVPGSCLASFHFLWAIHPIRPVDGVIPRPGSPPDRGDEFTQPGRPLLAENCTVEMEQRRPIKSRLAHAQKCYKYPTKVAAVKKEKEGNMNGLIGLPLSAPTTLPTDRPTDRRHNLVPFQNVLRPASLPDARYGTVEVRPSGRALQKLYPFLLYRHVSQLDSTRHACLHFCGEDRNFN